MSITFTSTPNGGTYAPKSVLATWIESSGGEFIKTIDRKSADETNRLVAWRAMAGQQDTDAVSGATRDNHKTPVTATWSIDPALPNGIYNIRVETADSNAVDPGQNHQATFQFEKNGTASITTPTDPNFLNVKIDYSGAVL